MLGSCLQAYHSISNIVRLRGLPLSWIPIWICYWTSFLSCSSPFLPLQFLQIGIILGQSFWLWDGNSIPPLDVLSLHWRWALQVPPPHCRALHPRSLPLSPESLSPPRSPVHSRGSSHFLPPKVAYFHSFCWLSGLQFPHPQYLIMLLSSPPWQCVFLRDEESDSHHYGPQPLLIKQWLMFLCSLSFYYFICNFCILTCLVKSMQVPLKV